MVFSDFGTRFWNTDLSRMVLSVMSDGVAEVSIEGGASEWAMNEGMNE